MAQPKKKQAPQTPAAKLEAALIKLSGQEVVDGILEADVDGLKAKLVALAAYENDTEKTLKEHEEINEMKEALKEAQAPFKDTLKGIKLQRNFIAMQLEEKGKA